MKVLSRLSKKKTAVGEKKHPTSSSNENIDNEHDDNVQEEDLDDGSISAVDSDILEGPSRDFTPYRSASGPEEEGQATTIARAETKAVQWLKLLVLLVLILSATGVGIAVYKYTSRSEQEQFQEAFEGNSRKVLEVQFEAGLRWLVGSFFRSFVRSQALRFPHTNGCLPPSCWFRCGAGDWDFHGTHIGESRCIAESFGGLGAWDQSNLAVCHCTEFLRPSGQNQIVV